MRRLLFFIVSLMAVATVSAQDIKSDNLQDFTKISLTGKVNVVLEKADTNSVEIKLIESDPSKFEWSIKDGALSMRLRPDTHKQSSAEIRIKYKEVTNVILKGGTAKLETKIQSRTFKVEVSGGANLICSVDVSDLTVVADGASAVSVEGLALYTTVRANSSAKVDARYLESRSVIANTNFGAEIFVWGTERLDATASGSSTIYYKGNPDIFNKNTRLMGVVEQFSL